MGTFTKGDIILFPFPYTNMKNSKIRPCLVLSDEISEDIILCQITSKKTIKDEYSIELKTDETNNGNLKVDSLIRCNMLFIADKQQCLKVICNLDSNKYKVIIDKICEIITK